MSRQQLMNLYQRQIAQGGSSSGGRMREEGGLFTAASRAGLAEYQAWRRAYSLEFPGASRDELKMAWRQHKASMGGPPPGSRGRKPAKGVRHCMEYKEVETKKGPARRCAAWAKGPRGSALVGGYSDMTPMRGMALVGGARMSKGVRHCMEEALGPSGMRRCKKFMPGPRSAMHGRALVGGGALVGGFPGQRDILSAWAAAQGQCHVSPKDRAARAAATQRARAAYDAKFYVTRDFREGAKEAARALGVELTESQIKKLRLSKPKKSKAAVDEAKIEHQAEQAHEAAAQLEVAAENAAAQGAPAQAQELQAAANAAEAEAEDLDALLEGLI